MLTVENAIDCFTSSFCYLRSFNYPYIEDSCDGITVMHDNPLRGEKSRTSEIVIKPSIEPQRIHQMVAGFHSHPRILLSAFSLTSEETLQLKSQYKGYGYRLLRTLPMFQCSSLSEYTNVLNYNCVEVFSTEQAEMLKQALGHTLVKCGENGILDSKIKIFYVELDGAVVGWVRSIRCYRNISYISDVNVLPEYRRRGIGTALMHALVNSNYSDGFLYSVLLATSAGSKLYQSTGFKEIAMLQMFALNKAYK